MSKSEDEQDCIICYKDNLDAEYHVHNLKDINSRIKEAKIDLLEQAEGQMVNGDLENFIEATLAQLRGEDE